MNYIFFGNFIWISIFLAVFFIMISDTVEHSLNNLKTEKIFNAIFISLSVVIICAWIFAAGFLFFRKQFFVT